MELLSDQIDGDSPPKQSSGTDSPPKHTEGDSAVKVSETEENKGRRGSAFGEELKDRLGNLPKLQRQRTRTRTISTSVYQDDEGRCEHCNQNCKQFFCFDMIYNNNPKGHWQRRLWETLPSSSSAPRRELEQSTFGGSTTTAVSPCLFLTSSQQGAV